MKVPEREGRKFRSLFLDQGDLRLRLFGEKSLGFLVESEMEISFVSGFSGWSVVVVMVKCWRS